MKDELWRKSATELAALIREKQVSSREVVESHLARIETVNPKVNAITVVLAESALSAADAADKIPATGPLHGVPFTIKENIDCTGSATTNGVPVLAEAMPSVDSPVVQRMKSAGAIPLARTNLPEMGLRIATDNPLRGRTLNPWDSERTAGGSSGGEASAISTGMSPIGLGNDIGGSLRNPAFCCGITSIKATVGRIPHATSMAPQDGGIAAQIMAVEGPMARHVKDVRLGYEILSGRDPRDPVSVDAPLYGPEPANKKVAVVTEIPGVELAVSLVNAIRDAANALKDAGWDVVEILPPELEQVHEIWAYVLSMDFNPMLPDLSKLMTKPPIDMLKALFVRNDPNSVTLPYVHSERNRLSRIWSEFFTDYPIMVGPTWTDIQFLHDADVDPDTGMELTIDRIRFISPANVLGLPSAAVPTGVANGLPTGVQVYADKWREDLCLEGAEIIESRLGHICPIDPVF
ncbi:MAG: amidase [bacterium]|nr:indole acetimide hydrolase [Gammaproteobacteria bacterium]HIL99237.1 indole acetimide hydrolase [Pseudomonadales bacterium]